MLKRRLKEPFGKAGLTVAILALVLAMVGGAYAAGGLTSQQEKQVKKIAKKFAGKPGATGAAGTNGTNGTNGAPGKSGTAGKEGPEGKEGSPWTAGGTLPKGSSEKGAWAISVPVPDPTATLSLTRGPISFGIPLQTEPTAVFLKAGEGETTECPGNAEEPKAAAGKLCVYTEFELDAPELSVTTHTFGALVAGNGGEPGGVAGGSWAMTAP